jgi:hypothetical protein
MEGIMTGSTADLRASGAAGYTGRCAVQSLHQTVYLFLTC